MSSKTITGMKNSYRMSSLYDDEILRKEEFEKSIQLAHEERHFTMAERKYHHGQMAQQVPEILSPVEKGIISRIPIPTANIYSVQVKGFRVVLQETDMKPRPLGTTKVKEDSLLGWYEYVGVPYVDQGSVLKMSDDVKSDIVQAVRFLQYDTGFFIQYDIEYYDLSRLCPRARLHMAGALCISSGQGFLDFDKNGEVVRYTDAKVEDRGGVPVTHLVVPHALDPLSSIVTDYNFVVQKNALVDPLMLRGYDVAPKRICMFDIEGVQAGGEQIPWCAGIVLMEKWKIISTRMIYFAESITHAFSAGKKVGRDIMTYMDFRMLLETICVQGYLLYVKGVTWEYKMINDLLTCKSNVSAARISQHVYQAPLSETQWRFVLHDLQTAPFDVIYPYYKNQLRIPFLEQFTEDYDNMGHGLSGHVPVVECLFFLHHWKRTTEYLYGLCRAISWNPVYLQKRPAMEVHFRERDIWLVLSMSDPLTTRVEDPEKRNTDERIRHLPPPQELGPLVYKGPALATAFATLSARLGHFIYEGLQIQEEKYYNLWETDENEQFKLYYGEYFLIQPPLRTLAKQKGVRPADLVRQLGGYGWAAIDNIPPLLEVAPTWWTSQERFEQAVLARGEPKLTHALDWDKVQDGDLVELYALTRYQKDYQTRKLSDPINIAKARLETNGKSDEELRFLIMNNQKDHYICHHTEVEFEGQKNTLVVKSPVIRVTRLYRLERVYGPKTKDGRPPYKDIPGELVYGPRTAKGVGPWKE